MFVRSDAVRLPFADRSFDLCIGSPPYADARLYLEDEEDIGIARGCADWVAWMLRVTAESLRVTKGPVVWVCAGVTRGRNYQPGPEGLLWEWWKRGGECHCMRPVFWHRSGIPGSGGDQGFRCDVEYCLIFKRPGKFPWSDVTANGGETQYKTRNTSCRRKNNYMEYQKYIAPDLANPGNLFRTSHGGGNLGSNLAHENEAPFPVAVPEWFVASYCPPGGIVIDPFSGSGTTCHAARNLGRRAVGCDIRQSQCRIGVRRLSGVTPGFSFSFDGDE